MPRTSDAIRRFLMSSEVGDAFSREGTTTWNAITPEARAPLFAAAYLANPRKTLIVTPTYERALAWQAKLQICGVPGERIHQLPSALSSLFEDSPPESVAISSRLGALHALLDDEPDIVLASPQAALERTLNADTLRAAFVTLQVGDSADLAQLRGTLVSLGYELQEPVRMPGTFSQRGGILDIFPSGHDRPVRIEFFGDEVESLRFFDQTTQRSVGTAPALTLAPGRETLYPPTGGAHVAEEVRNALEREIAAHDDEAAERLRETVAADANLLEQGAFFDRIDLYRPWIFPDSGCAVDLLSDDAQLVIDEPLEVEIVAERTMEEVSQALSARADRGEILHATVSDFVVPVERLGEFSERLVLTTIAGMPPWCVEGTVVEIGASSLEPYRGRPEHLANTLRRYRSQGVRVVMTSDQPNRASTVLSGAELTPNADLESVGPILVSGNLGGGFVMPERKLAVVTDAELFGVARLKLPQRRFNEGEPVATVLDLKPGDYVVHISFGIGIFRGLVKRTIEGLEKEYLYIDYAAPDKLFVPADQLDRIQKYQNPADTQPKLNKLTGGEWQRTLGKAKEEAKAFARDLVRLYASRQQVRRRAYGPDSPFQDEMEGTFPYVETRSQMKAIVEAKKDLERPYPMDRLVCGDVGFGKTEVAIRVAFKVVQGGRQVAVLCPTTILAEQHYRNFHERLSSFGTKLAIVNRFTTTVEKKEILAGLKSGEIEIIVGTHSLLGKGIEFKDLGLVVIDEEQKFGVKQKEMLKELRTEIDVLTLSATPIPRTLSMALMDIRQMSLINDPPPGRLPVRTFVRPWGAEVVRDAILRELARGGQVFYVYNRVESIEHIAEKLRKLVPMARIGVGHGQMTEKELEPIMVGFIKGEIDVLLSTTIVENGIDISNANTLIVENADRLGLSQLYQLRGRVGRSDRQAYAYFLYSGAMDATLQMRDLRREAYGLDRKKKRTVTEGAFQRLQALQEFSALGSGYSLAFRDLQIRGAGELLGAKQSGAMATVGYELYQSLIQEAVAQLKHSVDGDTESAEQVVDPLAKLEPLPPLEIPVKALIPDSYITEAAQRLYYYQRLMSVRDESQLADTMSEIEDRYGKPPREVSNLFRVMGQRLTARELSFSRIEARNKVLNVKLVDVDAVSPRIFQQLTKRNSDAHLRGGTLHWPYQDSTLAAIDNLFNEWRRVTTAHEAARSAIA